MRLRHLSLAMLSAVRRLRRGPTPWMRPPLGLTVSAALAAVLAMDLSAASASAPVAAPTIHALASTRQSISPYTPAQIETAYNVSPLLSRGIDGSGGTIALLELDRFDPADIQYFDTVNNLPDPTVQEFYSGGSPFQLPIQGETTMDLEWAHALAPGAKIQIYYLKGKQANAAGWRSVAAAVNSAVAAGAGVVSLSFGACSPTTGYTVASAAFASAMKHGVSVFVSSGDSGARPGPVRECGKTTGVGYPASDPSVVSVGGTSLLLNPNNTKYIQFAWSLSGGGKAKPMLRPSWQVTPNLSPGRYRYVPDVSFLANPATGAAVYYRGQWESAGGTSLGAPAWAAIWTLVREDAARAGKTPSSAPGLLYRIGNSPAYSTAFSDITSGGNGRYHATVGWDPVTGWGTPEVSGLSAAVAAIS